MKIHDILNTLKERVDAIVSYMRGGSQRASGGSGRRKDVQLILYIVIIVLINLVSLTLNSRCDLTRNRTFSLSDRSKEIVSNLKENLKIKVLFSKDLPAQHTSIYRYLVDLLEEYKYYSNEYFSYEIVGEKELEKEASNYGIRPVQSQEYDNDQVKVRRTYMALVIQQSDIVDKIEAITNPTGLEYNITSLIEKMSSKIDGLLSLRQPIQVLLFMDGSLKNLPIDGIDGLADKVKDAVAKCNAANYDKLQLDIVDPSVDTNAGISAELYGVTKLNWKQGLDRYGKPIPAGTAYLGIVLKNEDKAELVDISVAPTLFGKNVITGLDKIEDRINNAVGNLVSSNPRIGYITGHGEVDVNDQQTPQGGAVLRQVLSDVYDIKAVDLTKEDIPADLGTVIINGPRKQFTEHELFKIDQFLMKGKSAIFFLDSFYEVNFGQQNMFSGQQPVVIPVQTGLDPLLKFYGASVNKDIVLDTSCAKAPVAGAVREIYYVPIIRKAGLNKESVITKYLKGIAFLKASSVEADEGRVKELKLSRYNLVSSSEESWLMTGQINFNPFFMTPPQNKGDMKRHTLALLISGKFDSYFKGRDIPPADAKDKEKRKLIRVSKMDGTAQAGTTSIIVVGTSEIARSGFLMNSRRIMSSIMADGDDHDRIFSNGFFIHSMADYLLGNSYIPEMSSKSLGYNPLEKTKDTTKIILKSVNIAGVPILVVLAGLLIWRRRRERKNRIQGLFSGEVKHE